MIRCKRRNYKLGGSMAMTYPSGVIVGEQASIVGDRLLLVDPRGEIGEEDLLEFLEVYVEPSFWKWWRPKEVARSTKIQGVVKPMQAETLVPEEMKSVKAGPQVYLVNCWRCGGQISWQLNLGLQGRCPYCSALIQLVRR